MRRAFAPLAFALVSLLAASRAEAAPPGSRFVRQLTAPERIVSVESARDALYRHAPTAQGELVPVGSARVGDLTVYRFRQYRFGLPVYARGAAVAAHADGSVAFATANLDDTLPANTTPRMDAAQAAAIGAARSGRPATDADARLVVWPDGAGSRLAWIVRPATLLPLPYVPIVVIDDETGRAVGFQNGVRFKNSAKLYEFNPVSSPNLIDVTLPVADPNVSPDNADTLSFNCIDTKKTFPITYMGFSQQVHICELASMNTADGADAYPGEAFADDTNGDFVQYAPAADDAGSDPFAQLSIFYHTNQAYSFFRQFQPDFKLSTAKKSWPLYLIANLMLPAGSMSFDLVKMKDPNLPLEPFSNAFYSGWDPNAGFNDILTTVWPEIKGAGLYFGQGEKADYSYDGDVVYHEFSHAVVDSTAALIGWWHLDSQGASASPGAMNEAIADFFSSAIAGDPKSGEYACLDAYGPGCEGIRNLENDKRCPDWLTGEVHADSEFFSAPMWAVRAGLATADEKKTFDQAMFTALNTVTSGDLGYEDMASAFVASLKASSLGDTVGAAMETEFTKRGLLPSCKRMFSWAGTPISSKSESMAYSFIAAGTQDLGTLGASRDYAPGLFQIKVPLSAGSTKVKVTLNELSTASGMPFSQGTPFTPAVLVGFDQQIEFEATGKANTSTLVDASSKNLVWTAEFDVTAGASEAYVMIVNKGQLSGYYYNIKIEETAPTTPDAGPDAPAGEDAAEEASVEQDSGSGEQPTTKSEDDGGCGCRVPAQSPVPGSAAALLALAGLAVLRRKR